VIVILRNDDALSIEAAAGAVCHPPRFTTAHLQLSFDYTNIWASPGFARATDFTEAEPYTSKPSIVSESLYLTGTDSALNSRKYASTENTCWNVTGSVRWDGLCVATDQADPCAV